MVKHRDDIYQDKSGTWWARVGGKRKTLNTYQAHVELFNDMQLDAERAALERQFPDVIVLRGAPGCGKSTWAAEFIKVNPEYKRISRDQLRLMLDFGEYSSFNERFIRDVRKRLIRACIENGHSVIVDDTNLKPRDISDARQAARYWSHSENRYIPVAFRVIDVLATLEECIARDAQRERPVGAQRIRELYEQWEYVRATDLYERPVSVVTVE